MDAVSSSHVTALEHKLAMAAEALATEREAARAAAEASQRKIAELTARLAVAEVAEHDAERVSPPPPPPPMPPRALRTLLPVLRQRTLVVGPSPSKVDPRRNSYLQPGGGTAVYAGELPPLSAALLALPRPPSSLAALLHPALFEEASLYPALTAATPSWGASF